MKTEDIENEKKTVGTGTEQCYIIPAGNFFLQCWGGIYNNDLIKKHFGLEGGNFWFETVEDRNIFKDTIKRFADKQGQAVSFAEYEGADCKKRTVAKIVLTHEGKDYPLEYDFGYGFPEDAAFYMWEDGNYSCDCNKSIFLHEKYPEVPETDTCGDKIKIKTLEILKEI